MIRTRFDITRLDISPVLIMLPGTTFIMPLTTASLYVTLSVDCGNFAGESSNSGVHLVYVFTKTVHIRVHRDV